MTVGEMRELLETSLMNDYDNILNALLSLVITMIQMKAFSEEEVVDIMQEFNAHIKERGGNLPDLA